MTKKSKFPLTICPKCGNELENQNTKKDPTWICCLNIWKVKKDD